MWHPENCNQGATHQGGAVFVSGAWRQPPRSKDHSHEAHSRGGAARLRHAVRRGVERLPRRSHHTGVYLVERYRGSASSRGYDHQWRRVRAAFLLSHSLCKHCEIRGQVTAADEVHHKLKVADRPDLRLVWSNLEALCKPCHSAETQRESAGLTHLPGCDAAGRPIDPDHPWNVTR